MSEELFYSFSLGRRICRMNVHAPSLSLHLPDMATPVLWMNVLPVLPSSLG